MKIFEKALISTIIVLILNASFVTQPVFARGDLGECGPAIDGSYGGDPVALCFEGKGELYLYTNPASRPWNTVSNSVRTIVFGEGITRITAYAFKGMSNVETVFLPPSMKSIDSGAFQDCYALKNIYYFGTVDEWNAFKVNIEGDNGKLSDSSILTCCDKDIAVLNLRTPEGLSAKVEWAVVIVSCGMPLPYWKMRTSSGGQINQVSLLIWISTMTTTLISMHVSTVQMGLSLPVSSQHTWARPYLSQ